MRTVGTRAVLAGLVLAAVASTAGGTTPADPLIGRNGDVFQAGRDGIRHRQSGVTCPHSLANMPLTRLMVYPTTTVRGSDVSCGYGSYPGGAVTLYMIRPGDYPRPMAYAAYAGAARQEVMLAHPAIADAPAPPAPAITLGDGSSRRASVDAWHYADHGVDLYSLLYLSDAHPWVVMVRATAPIGQEQEISAAGGQAWETGARTVGQ